MPFLNPSACLVVLVDTQPPAEKQRVDPIEGLDFGSAAVFGFSWLLVLCIGLLPLLESLAQRPPSISMPAVIIFFVATGSGAAVHAPQVVPMPPSV